MVFCAIFNHQPTVVFNGITPIQKLKQLKSKGSTEDSIKNEYYQYSSVIHFGKAERLISSVLLIFCIL